MRPKQFNFKFVVDTREQRPYHFKEDDVRKKLDTGDYSIEGLEDCICVERKSLSDFINCVIPTRSGKINPNWKRFQRELHRMQTFELSCIVVESDWFNVCKGEYRSDIHPSALQGLITRIIVDYNIPVYFRSVWANSQKFVEKWLQRAALKFHPALVGEENGTINN